MASQIFKNGQVVLLKSGGPRMTIENYDEEYCAYDCTWFERNKIQRAKFTEQTLELVKESNGPSFYQAVQRD